MALGVCDGVADAEGVLLGVLDGVWLGVDDGVWLGVLLGVWLGVWLGVDDGVWLGVLDGVADADGVDDADGVLLGVLLGVWLGVEDADLPIRSYTPQPSNALPLHDPINASCRVMFPLLS